MHTALWLLVISTPAALALRVTPTTNRATCAKLESAIMSPSCVQSYPQFVEGIVKRFNEHVVPVQPLHYALQNLMTPAMAGKDKLWLEFGVFKGDSTRLISNALSQKDKEGKLYAFDSFQGLPEDWKKGYDGFPVSYPTGGFKYEKEPFQHPQVSYVKGWFNESLPQFLKSAEASNKQITFMHLDADLYSSTKTVLMEVAPMVATNAIVVFDDLLNFPTYRDGELKALYEFMQKTGRSIEVMAACSPVDLNPEVNVFKNTGCEPGAVRIL